MILNKLKQLGIDSNTIVFFTSDNGPWIDQELAGGSAGMLKGGKGSTWEGGVREPTIIWWPGKIAPGSVNMDIGSTMDIFVTALELAGASLPDDREIDGVSLIPALFGTGNIPREYYFYFRDDKLYAVRYGPYKAHYITRSGFGIDPPEYHNPPLLFQIEHDPGELYPMNSTSPINQQILQTIQNEVEQMYERLTPGVPQLNDQDPLVEPCCDFVTGCYCGPWQSYLH